MRAEIQVRILSASHPCRQDFLLKPPRPDCANINAYLAPAAPLRTSIGRSRPEVVDT